MNDALTEILENYIKHNEIELILDRIKEVVDEKNIDYGEELSLSECKTLLNYITNLQDYKSRCEKAIEDIQFCLKSIYQEKGMSKDERTRSEMETCIQVFKGTLNILKGVKDE